MGNKISGFFSIKTKIIIAACLIAIGFVLVFVAGVTAIVASSNSQSTTMSGTELSDEVEQYRSTVEKIAEDFGIKEYTDHLLCIMQEETSGLGTDVMNAGAFQSNTKYDKNRGSILNPNYSIECGVSEFADLLKLANVADINDKEKLKIVYQAYHSDRNYIDVALANGGYTEENAKKYLSENGYPDYVSGAFGDNVAFWYQLITGGTGQFIHPLTSTVISSPFGYRDGTYSGFHGGVDFPAPKGTPVYASADGIVTMARVNGTYGNCVMIKHSATYTTLYAHNNSFNVKEGEKVKQGDIIAFVGSTGRSSGPHCHFEIRVNGKRVDPIPYLNNLSE